MSTQLIKPINQFLIGRHVAVVNENFCCLRCLLFPSRLTSRVSLLAMMDRTQRQKYTERSQTSRKTAKRQSKGAEKLTLPSSWKGEGETNLTHGLSLCSTSVIRDSSFIARCYFFSFSFETKSN